MSELRVTDAMARAAAEPVRKPDGWVAGADAGVIARGLSARVYGDRRLAGGDAAHAVYIGTPPATPVREPEQLGVARDIRDTAAKLLARAGAREDDDARFMVRMALACDRHAADLGYYTPAAPVREPDGWSEALLTLRPTAHRHMTLRESYATLAQIFGEVGRAHVALSKSGRHVAGMSIDERVDSLLATPPVAEPVREPDGCTGIAAVWCPQHGTCTCTDRERLDTPDCPLHGYHSAHAAPVAHSASCALAPFTAADDDLRRRMNGQPWSLRDVLARLADAADHLLDAHCCDAHGYEGVIEARNAARTAVVQLAAAPVRDGALDVSRLDDDALIDVAQRVEHECTQRRIPQAAPVRDGALRAATLDKVDEMLTGDRWRALHEAAPRSRFGDSEIVDYLDARATQIDWDYDGEDEDTARHIYEITGNVNDRQWRCVGRGRDLREAVRNAIKAAALHVPEEE
jgi:hypothetical protein